jgi:Glucodextranase, domain B
MGGDASKGYSHRRRTTVCAAAILSIIAMTVTACGAAKSPTAVQLSLTAPTDGATVTVSKVKVFGSVHPASAAVLVSGHRVHVSNGVFGRWVTLHEGASHIKVVATAVGLAPAKLNIAVRSSPRPSQRPVRSEPAAVAAVRPVTGDRYDPRIQANILRSCEATAGYIASAEASCECYLSHLEARASENTLIASERAILKGEAKFPRWLLAAALSCRKR